MVCKCGHLALEHFPDRGTGGELVIPCVRCDCKDYKRDATKTVGF